MAKTKISEYDATAANNTDIDSINIAEGMAPSNVNNAIRELMAHLKDGLGAGTPVYLDDTNTRVGIGTTSPDKPLHILSTTPDQIVLEANSTTIGPNIIFKNTDGNLARIASAETNSLRFEVGPSNTEAMRIDSSGNVGIGATSPSSKLHIDDADDAASGFRMNNTAGESVQFYYASSAADADFIVNRTGSGAADMGIDHEGNVYFTSGNVGIGTSSPDTTLVVEESAITQTAQGNDIAVFKRNADGYIKVYSPNTGLGGIAFGDTDDPFIGAIRYQHSTDHLDFYVNNAERMRIDSSGNVGVGTSSPDGRVDIAQDQNTTKFTSPHLALTATSTTDTTGFTGISYAVSGVANYGWTAGALRSTSGNNSAFVFTQHNNSASGTERARLDGSGNLLVGTTTNSSANNGVTAGNSGLITATRTSNYSAIFHRKTSDGDIVQFRKDNGTAGVIGTKSGYITIGKQDTGLLFNSGVDAIYPWNMTLNGTRDNAVDIGYSTSRFDDVYATNGTIQTSDRNEKQQIASMTDAEITAAKAISKLFKTFKWNDSVTEKGDAARTHAGVIAQDVEQAMTDAGLDAGDYAFFISDTWWETYTDMPAVAAVDEVLDDDGNVVTEAVEAQEAYTHTDYFYEADEAPEGATERTRKGIRYPELLSFIGAATEQRLASIESRLDALESA